MGYMLANAYFMNLIILPNLLPGCAKKMIYATEMPSSVEINKHKENMVISQIP